MGLPAGESAGGGSRTGVRRSPGPDIGVPAEEPDRQQQPMKGQRVILPKEAGDGLTDALTCVHEYKGLIIPERGRIEIPQTNGKGYEHCDGAEGQVCGKVRAPLGIHTTHYTLRHSY